MFQKARKSAFSVRLNYDAARQALKTARPDKTDVLRGEMERSEGLLPSVLTTLIQDEFVSIVDDAMGKMKLVVEGPETLKNLADMVKAQLKYFKETFEVISMRIH